MKTLIILIGFNLILGTGLKPFCKCDKHDSLQSEIEQSDLVMIGDVLGKSVISKNVRDENGKKQNLRLTQYEIKVYKSYKGIKRDELIFLLTMTDMASCGLKLETNHRYTIFGNKGTFLSSDLEKLLSDSEKRSYWSSSCSRTMLYKSGIGEQIELELQK